MVDKQLLHEQRVLVPSIKVRNYVDLPQMSAPIITKNVMHSLETDSAAFYLINYANADMVGHSGDLQATIEACQVLDEQLAKLYCLVVEQMDGTLFIVSDHGNAEEKIDAKTGEARTAHTTNPVPFMIVNKACENFGASEPFTHSPERGLACVAPTILKHLGLNIPDVMEREILLFLLH
jgi:2,3-bisphosphoglycerate-independent phosphoglycerate mutase